MNSLFRENKCLVLSGHINKPADRPFPTRSATGNPPFLTASFPFTGLLVTKSRDLFRLLWASFKNCHLPDLLEAHTWRVSHPSAHCITIIQSPPPCGRGCTLDQAFSGGSYFPTVTDLPCLMPNNKGDVFPGRNILRHLPDAWVAEHSPGVPLQTLFENGRLTRDDPWHCFQRQPCQALLVGRAVFQCQHSCWLSTLSSCYKKTLPFVSYLSINRAVQ